LNKPIGILAVTTLATTVAMGDIYTDQTGDIATGNANLDITQVEVTDNGVDLIVSLTVDSLDADWGKCLFFGNAGPGGSGYNDNPWGRDIGGLDGSDLFLGSWLDNGGGTDVQGYDGGWSPMAMNVGLESIGAVILLRGH